MGDEEATSGAAPRTDGTDTGKEATEVEWQFDALDLRPVERWLAAVPSRAFPAVPTLTVLAKPTRRLVDRYLDTTDWRVGQAGFVLRTRQRGRAVEVTLKATRPANPAGLRKRLELTESLPSGLGSLGAGGPVGRRVHAVAGRRPLVQVLEIRTRRQPFSLRAAGTEVAEVALDDTTILVGANEAPARLRRVEVEVAAGWLDTLGPVVADLRESAGLSPAVLSKFEAGLLAAGASVPGPPDVGPTDVAPGATLGDVTYAVIRKQLRVLLTHEPGTRLGDDPEELHDMRVATRRLRAAMELFSSALPARAAAIRDELRWIAGALGDVRDLDVQLEDMAEMADWSAQWSGAGHGSALVHLRTLLDAERDDARRRLLDALDSTRWERLTSALLALARQGPSRRVPGARVPAAIAIPSLLDQRHRAVRKAAKKAHRTGAATDFHRVRIRGKRLRYSIEFTSALYGEPASRFTAKLTRLQDALGAMQDAEVASSRLFSLATETPPPGTSLPTATVFVMGGIAERYRQESVRLRASMATRLKALNGKAWRELDAAVERARRDAEALPVPSPYARTPRPPRPASQGADGAPPPPAPAPAATTAAEAADDAPDAPDVPDPSDDSDPSDDAADAPDTPDDADDAADTPDAPADGRAERATDPEAVPTALSSPHTSTPGPLVDATAWVTDGAPTDAPSVTRT
ncbi:MAG TPA: CHAD domain-containing protein [Acidimicrobiales bacterium]|nr:CHAD domain-containing protein [Acidimicrobiales bacterium]